MDLVDPELRFDRMADAMGVPARRVDRPEDLGPVLQEAIGHQGGPFLVDVVLESPVPFH
jgi:benzoylformate decarboxylase